MCADEYQGNCCTGMDACNLFTPGSVCCDGNSCMGDESCHGAEIQQLVQSCNGTKVVKLF